jgi:hypothetical protein
MRALCIVPLRKEGAGSRARKRYHNAECGHMNNALRWGKPAGVWALGLLAVRIARMVPLQTYEDHRSIARPVED